MLGVTCSRKCATNCTLQPCRHGVVKTFEARYGAVEILDFVVGWARHADHYAARLQTANRAGNAPSNSCSMLSKNLVICSPAMPAIVNAGLTASWSDTGIQVGFGSAWTSCHFYGGGAA
jgi:hypothetical protein